MYIHHQSCLPDSYYDTIKDKIILKLKTDGNAAAVTLLYGDPFLWRKTGKQNPVMLNPEMQNPATDIDIWEWSFFEAPMCKLYSWENNVCLYSNETITHWYIELTPPKTRRMKYHFIITDKHKNKITYGENGVGEPDSYFFFPFIHETDAPKAPVWANQTIWYQIFPERFYSGDPTLSPAITEDWNTGTPKAKNFFGGDLRGIINKLPYLHDLGVTGIYMTPVFHSPSNHKYDTQDYFSVDPHFGDTLTLRELVKKAHALGIKVILDGVFNHIGTSHPFWRDVLKKQEKSRYKDYFHIHNFPVLEKYENRETLNYDTFAFVPGMPKWNTENPKARKYLIDVALHWIKECDIDGWRLDVSDEVSFSFWQAMRETVNAEKPGFYLLGEIWHDPSKWLNGGYFDAVMNYPLGHLLRDLFFTRKITPQTFTQKLFSRLGKISDIHSRMQFNLMDSHDTVRVLTQANGDKTALKNAFMFLFLIRGVPCIYYGTEIGLEGNGDPGSRGPMLWEESKQDRELHGFFKELIEFRKKHNDTIQNGGITYKNGKNFYRWSFGNGSLDFIYNTGDKKIQLKGEVLLTSQHKKSATLSPGFCAVVKPSNV
jgi:glycosidase